MTPNNPRLPTVNHDARVAIVLTVALGLGCLVASCSSGALPACTDDRTASIGVCWLDAPPGTNPKNVQGYDAVVQSVDDTPVASAGDATCYQQLDETITFAGTDGTTIHVAFSAQAGPLAAPTPVLPALTALVGRRVTVDVNSTFSTGYMGGSGFTVQDDRGLVFTLFSGFGGNGPWGSASAYGSSFAVGGGGGVCLDPFDREVSSISFMGDSAVEAAPGEVVAFQLNGQAYQGRNIDYSVRTPQSIGADGYTDLMWAAWRVNL